MLIPSEVVLSHLFARLMALLVMKVTPEPGHSHFPTEPRTPTTPLQKLFGKFFTKMRNIKDGFKHWELHLYRLVSEQVHANGRVSVFWEALLF